MNFKNFSPQIGKDVFIAPNASLIGRCFVGDDSSIWYSCVIRADVNEIHIGKNTSIQDGSIIHVTHYKTNKQGHPTIIGNNVTVAHGVILHGCTIEDACLIGMGAIVIDGARIGKESIVGAGTLVTKGKIFPPRSLILGNPARLVRELNDQEVKSIYDSAKRYVGFKNDYLNPQAPYFAPDF